MERSAQNEGRLLTGREMVRAICHWCSARSELGQHRMSRDIFQVVIDPNKPDADLHHFYNEWTDVNQQLYGARPPSDEMRALIHARFIEQRRMPNTLNFVCQLYDLSKDKLGHCAKTYEWLMGQIEGMMLHDKEEWNTSVHESTLNQ
eukprot:3838271-Pyramimonas_sp.AAC.1